MSQHQPESARGRWGLVLDLALPPGNQVGEVQTQELTPLASVVSIEPDPHPLYWRPADMSDSAEEYTAGR
jgi:hypothetical protein